MNAINRRYSNGNTRDQQNAANTRYRRKQQRLRSWVDDIAEQLGLTRDELISSPAVLVAELLSNKEIFYNETNAARED
ncbi:hypothetical protein ACUY2X_10205 [Corynebacterium minutissimum]